MKKARNMAGKDERQAIKKTKSSGKTRCGSNGQHLEPVAVISLFHVMGVVLRIGLSETIFANVRRVPGGQTIGRHLTPHREPISGISG